jgi:hypothetical protein
MVLRYTVLCHVVCYQTTCSNNRCLHLVSRRKYTLLSL